MTKKQKPLSVERFTVHFHNKEEALEIKREIFTEHTYYFETDNPQPVIIDAGAHIGLATLYFKKQYPGAIITAVEALPQNFGILEKNVWENNVSDVSTINAVLSDHDGTETIYFDKEKLWLSTTSIHESAWNGQQKSTSTSLPTIQLSTLLDQPVDLLKLDIEGAETRVLHEAADELRKVQQMIIEFHPTNDQNLEKFLEFLEKQNFETTVLKHGKTIRPQFARGLVMIEAHQR